MRNKIFIFICLLSYVFWGSSCKKVQQPTKLPDQVVSLKLSHADSVWLRTNAALGSYIVQESVSCYEIIDNSLVPDTNYAIFNDTIIISRIDTFRVILSPGLYLRYISTINGMDSFGEYRYPELKFFNNGDSISGFNRSIWASGNCDYTFTGHKIH